MRVISGELKGRSWRVPRGSTLRPTSERVREAVFSSLQSMIELSGIAVLDLYAGSGALGLEALSRGAQFACFVEKEKNLCDAIKERMIEFGLEDRSAVIQGLVPDWLAPAKVALPDDRKYEVVFVDPPYDMHPGLAVAEWLIDTRVVCNGTILVIESRGEVGADESGAGKSHRFFREKEKCYGDTTVSYYIARSVR